MVIEGFIDFRLEVTQNLKISSNLALQIFLEDPLESVVSHCVKVFFETFVEHSNVNYRLVVFLLSRKSREVLVTNITRREPVGLAA